MELTGAVEFRLRGLERKGGGEGGDKYIRRIFKMYLNSSPPSIMIFRSIRVSIRQDFLFFSKTLNATYS